MSQTFDIKIPSYPQLPSQIHTSSRLPSPFPSLNQYSIPISLPISHSHPHHPTQHSLHSAYTCILADILLEIISATLKYKMQNLEKLVSEIKI